jgi:multidrug efflux system outer membrane protein
MRPTALLLALLLTGCALAPRYERPQGLAPKEFRDAAAVTVDQPAGTEKTFGELDWWEVFEDEQLQALIRQGLEYNYDIRAAAQRVLQAQAQAIATQSGLFPSVSASAQGDKTDRFQIGSTPLEAQKSLLGSRDPSAGSESFMSALNLAWELDFWGRIRSASEASRAQLLATEAGRQAVIQSVVTGIAQAYLDLRESDLELEIAKTTLASRQKSLKLVQARKQWGVATRLDVRQSEALLETAAATIPLIEAQIAQAENYISILIGADPGAVPRGKSLNDQQMTIEVPAGLPSSLLDRRPDLRAAEEQLIAANANVGEARAALFPQITLTAALGTVSPALAGVFDGPTGVTNVAPAAVLPLFNAGKLRAGVQAAKAQREEALLNYQKAVQQALREVSDALIGCTKAKEARDQMEALVNTWRDAAHLSQLRYIGGVTSYLEVLDSERQLFDAELNYAQAKRNELLTVVALYKALGGGWENTAPKPQAQAEAQK